MSTSTARALLVLPDPSENYSVPIVNANMTALDGHLGFAPFTSSTRPASAFSGRAIRETDTEKIFYSRGTAPISASWVQILTEAASANLASSASFMIGGDTRIYRTGAAALRTTGSWTVDTNLAVTGTTTASGTLTTNGAANVGGALTVTGTATACGSLAGWGGTWSSYTPTLTNVTLGTGSTTVARYFQLGKLVFVQIQIILGTGGDVTGNIAISLPVTARATQPVLWGMGVALDDSAGTGQRAVGIQAASTTTINMVNPLTGGTVGTTNPHDWAVNDQLRLSFFYEAA